MQKITTLLGEIKVLDARATYNKVTIQIDFDGARDTLTIYPKNKELIKQFCNINTSNKRAAFVSKYFVNEIDKQIDKYMYES